MGWLDGLKLERLDVAQNQRRPLAPVRATVLERKDRKRAAQTAEDALRAACWARDKGKSRATGKPLLKGSSDPAKRGEVAHLVARSTDPAKRLTLANVVLLSAEEHALSDPRTAGAKGKALLEVKGRSANKAITFIRRNEQGRVLWRTTSTPDSITKD